MSPIRALTIAATVLLVLGGGLVAWSLAPPVPGFDAPKTVLDQGLTGQAGNTFPADPFVRLQEAGGTYRLDVEADSTFVIGERRADRPDDPIRESGALGYNAGGDARFYHEAEFRSTPSGTSPSSPERGPKEFFIKFPGATEPQPYTAVATFTPTMAEPFIVLKAWGSIAGLVLAAAGALAFLGRGLVPLPGRTAPEADAEAPAPEAEEPRPPQP